MKVEINEDIKAALQKRVDKTDEFKSLEEYVNYVLKQVVDRLNEESSNKKDNSEKDEKIVRERLKSLGYLD